MTLLLVAWKAASCLATLLAFSGEEGPVGGDYGPPRVVVSAPSEARYAHLAWPKVVRTADARGLRWKRLGLVAALPKEAKEHADWSYPWMTPLDGSTWFVVFYSGKVKGANSIYGLTIRPENTETPK